MQAIARTETAADVILPHVYAALVEAQRTGQHAAIAVRTATAADEVDRIRYRIVGRDGARGSRCAEKMR